VGLPVQLPPIYSFLSVPIGYQMPVYGWLCLANKVGSDAFSEVDEQLAVTLAAQLAVAHENAPLCSSVQQQAAELAQEVDECLSIDAKPSHTKGAILQVSCAPPVRVRSDGGYCRLRRT
jgi:signal transduction protein with GAF and PtsI domain